jgi:hypothetical protein
VSETEFQSAKQGFIKEFDNADIVDRWLDADTFKTETPTKFYARASGTSLSDVQNVISRLQKQPIAVVVVSSSKASN